MMTLRLFPLAARAAAILPLVALISACVTAGGLRSAGSPAEREAAVDRGPRVQIWTTDEFGTGNRIRTSFRLDDDAYVIVVNVGLDGYANVIFPESPQDDGFMRGGRTYRLPGFFPGFASHIRASDHGRLYHATSAYDGIYDRYAGYVFIIASWRPMHFQVTESFGLWDDYRLAAHEERLEPYAVMHRFADQLMLGRARDYTARFARYAAYPANLARAGSFARCSFFVPGLGYFPIWTFHGLGGWSLPLSGFGHYRGGSSCGLRYGLSLAGVRPVAPPVVAPPVGPPSPPPPSPPVTDDTAAPPRYPRPARPPGGEGDTDAPKVPRGGRRVHVAEDEPIVDVTRATRDFARRRDRATDRVDGARHARTGARGSDTPSGWSRTERMRSSERADVPRDVERADAPRASARDNGARGESARGESRSSDVRREQPSRPEARPQPAPRSEPPARPEPRGERPAKPEPQ